VKAGDRDLSKNEERRTIRDLDLNLSLDLCLYLPLRLFRGPGINQDWPMPVQAGGM